MSAKPQNIPSIFEAIKDLTNSTYWNGELRTQIIICGTNQAYGILEVANWIQGRAFTIQLESLSKKEYSKFLMKIYKAYVSLGITDTWPLLTTNARGIPVLDGKSVKYLFNKTNGKVGLTVQIIKKALTNALKCGRKYPVMDDYENVVVLDKNINTDPKVSLKVMKSGEISK